MRGFKITIFGMITVSLDVRIVNVFVSTATSVRLYNTHAFGHCVIFFGQKGHRPPKSEGPRTPMGIDQQRMAILVTFMSL